MIGRWFSNMVGNMWERVIESFFARLCEDTRLSVTFVDRITGTKKHLSVTFVDRFTGTKKQPAPPPQQPVVETPPSSSNILLNPTVALGVCSLMSLAAAIVLDKIIRFRDDQPKKPPSSFNSRYAALFKEFERSGCQPIKSPNLAEKFRLQGNTAMQLKLYSDAIELYSYAIKLSERNSVCYCDSIVIYYNAFLSGQSCFTRSTNMWKLLETVRSPLKLIQIAAGHTYLGYAYFAQGKYRDAIDKGLMKALQLDPDTARLAEYLQNATIGGGGGGWRASPRGRRVLFVRKWPGKRSKELWMCHYHSMGAFQTFLMAKQ
ncbi:hypothetical protein IFM89_038197 [Coptis chinensis]|uniref:Uncharacterized protein n=1 Tax=Coptis chinensis TaxID=261450 RepID=A0A835IJN9_9MAGN|nr:hypothetical protein IFM89_038197 [Coptis chinensis]